MPTLPLPLGGANLGGGDLPVVDTTDVLAVLPAYLKPGDTALVRDGLVAALTQMLLTYQDRASYGAAQCDVLFATDSYLQGLGGDRGVIKQTAEADASLRARILATPALVTPRAILAAVNTILAPYSTVAAQYFESIQDRLFLRKGAPTATSFHSFIYKRGTARPSSPYYPDRLYADDAALNGGRFRPQSNPGGARVFKDTVGRFFVLRVPDISSINAGIIPVYTNTTGHPLPTLRPAGMYLYKAVSAGSPYGAYVRNKSATALTVYSAIVTTVERLRGSSIRWRMQVDQNLS